MEDAKVFARPLKKGGSIGVEVANEEVGDAGVDGPAGKGVGAVGECGNTAWDGEGLGVSLNEPGMLIVWLLICGEDFSSGGGIGSPRTAATS
jgi:hypothetical protein